MGTYRALISSVVARVDPGWLYLCAGSAVIVAGALLPARHDLEDARGHRDRAILAADYAARRVANYSAFLESLDAGDETVMTNLVATQLNLVPADKTPLFMLRSARPDDANVFHDLEPPPPADLPAPARRSMLDLLVTSEATRPWAVIGGMMCILIGLLPPSTPADAGRGPEPEPAGD